MFPELINRISTLKSLAVCGSIAAMVCQTGNAQPEITEISVTAQKRQQNIMDIPVSVTALENKRLTSYGNSRLSSAQYMVPNLIMTQDKPSSVGVFIRGIGNHTRNIGTDMRAGVYLDGVYLGRSQEINMESVNLERVEILRGPQGVMYGKNTVSGAINLITRKPTKSFSGKVRATAGSFGQVSSQLEINAPLAEDILSASLSYSLNRSDGYVWNQFNRSHMNGADTENGRLMLRFQPGQLTDINVSADWLQDDSPSIYRQSLTAEKNTVNHNSAESDSRTVSGVSISVDKELLNGYQLFLQTAYRESKFASYYDEDYSNLYIAQSDFNEENSQFSQEIRFSSPESKRLNYLLGLYYYTSEASSEREASLGPDATGSVVLPVRNNGQIKNRSSAMFAHANYNLIEKLWLSGGFRYTHETKRFRFDQVDRTGLFTTFEEDYDDTASLDEISSEIGLKYTASPEFMLYSKISRGFKSGGWNADFISSKDKLPYGSEYIDSIEAGIKRSYFNNILSLEFSAYYSQFTDYQVQQFRTDSNGGTIIVISNAAEVDSKGVEGELRAYFGPLSVVASVGLNKTVYQKYKDANGPGMDLDGEHLDVPKGNINMLVEYRQPISENISITYGLEYSRRFSQGNSGPLYIVNTIIPAHGILNGRLGIRHESFGFDIDIWGKNLTDQNYLLAHDASFLGAERWLYGPERAVGVSFSYNF